MKCADSSGDKKTGIRYVIYIEDRMSPDCKTQGIGTMIFANLESFIEQSARQEDVDSLFKLFAGEMELLGFDRLLMALMTDHPELNESARHGILKSYPESWVNHYLDKGYDSIDPIRASAFSHIGAFTWQQIIDNMQLTRKQQRMFDEAEEAGLHSGIGVALRGANGAVAAIGAASSVGNLTTDKHTLFRVNLLAQQFYTCFWQLMKKPSCGDDNGIPAIYLSDKEQEVLKWCARGYTKADIGERLCISQHTVDYHIRNSQKKLQARNITSAVVQAINRGLIQI